MIPGALATGRVLSGLRRTARGLGKRSSNLARAFASPELVQGASPGGHDRAGQLADPVPEQARTWRRAGHLLDELDMAMVQSEPVADTKEEDLHQTMKFEADAAQGQTLKRPWLRSRQQPEADHLNRGFVFIKPDSNTEKVREYLRRKLESSNIRIVEEGMLTGKEILERKAIDTHYGSLATKALLQRPEEHAVQADAAVRFERAFGLPWREALLSGRVVNAAEAMRQLGCTEEQLDDRWEPLELNVEKVKLGGGFYVGAIDGLFVVNGFYMAMRRKYVAPGKSVAWFSVEWSASELSWAQFREGFLGDTDPRTACGHSFRGGVHRRWQDFGLPAEPTLGDNVLHASASPFEAWLERVNWLGTDKYQDDFARLLIEEGIPESTLDHWSSDPVVVPEGGSPQSLFDLLENLDTTECIEKVASIPPTEVRADC